MRRYKQQWTAADSLNASIGQGYVSVSPLQLAVMTARIASGRNLIPSLMFGQEKAAGAPLPFSPEQLAVTHDGMFRVVNGSGTGGGSKINIGGIQMAGKTGTAQVRALVSRGHVGDWKSRDHSLFIAYAPTDAPRYAMSVVVEHGTFGARAAAPIAKDVMTYLFDRETALASLAVLEQGWGGTPTERMEARYRAYENQYGTTAPKVGDEEAVVNAAVVKADNAEAPIDNAANAAVPHRPEEPAQASSAPAADPARAAEPTLSPNAPVTQP